MYTTETTNFHKLKHQTKSTMAVVIKTFIAVIQ